MSAGSGSDSKLFGFGGEGILPNRIDILLAWSQEVLERQDPMG